MIALALMVLENLIIAQILATMVAPVPIVIQIGIFPINATNMLGFLLEFNRNPINGVI
jgi:hypothetical protein